MKRQLLLPAAAALLLAGPWACSSDNSATAPENVLARNDFENLLGWMGVTDPSIALDRAHSGHYAVKVGAGTEFGGTYIREMGQMAPIKPKTLKVRAWAWVPDSKNQGSIVLSISRPSDNDRALFYEAIGLAKAVKATKEWQLVEKTFPLPDDITSTDVLKVYLWRGGTPDAVFMDDIELSKVD